MQGKALAYLSSLESYFGSKIYLDLGYFEEQKQMKGLKYPVLPAVHSGLRTDKIGWK